MKKLDFRLFRRRLRAVPLFLRDKGAPWWKKAMIIGAVLYLLLPIDLIPPVIPLLGFADDAVIWALLIRYLGDDLDKYDLSDPRSNSSERYRGKDVVDVSYTVKDEEDKNVR